MLKQKLAKGLLSLTLVIVLLISILAGSFYFEDNGITSNVVKLNYINSDSGIQIKEIGARNLNQLNEGWYKIIGGHLYYLESFDNQIYIYSRIIDSDYQNRFFSIDSNGIVEFYEDYKSSNENLQNSGNEISGNAIGLEGVSGMQPAQTNSYSSILQLHINSGYIGGDTRFNFRFNQNTGNVEIQQVGQDNWQLPTTYAASHKLSSRANFFNDLSTKRDAQSMAGALYEEVRSGRDYSLSLFSGTDRVVAYYPGGSDASTKNTRLTDFTQSPYLSNPNYRTSMPTPAPPAPKPADISQISWNNLQAIGVQLEHRQTADGSYVVSGVGSYKVQGNGDIVFTPVQGSNLPPQIYSSGNWRDLNNQPVPRASQANIQLQVRSVPLSTLAIPPLTNTFSQADYQLLNGRTLAELTGNKPQILIQSEDGIRRANLKDGIYYYDRTDIPVTLRNNVRYIENEQEVASQGLRIQPPGTSPTQAITGITPTPGQAGATGTNIPQNTQVTYVYNAPNGQTIRTTERPPPGITNYDAEYQDVSRRQLRTVVRDGREVATEVHNGITWRNAVRTDYNLQVVDQLGKVVHQAIVPAESRPDAENRLRALYPGNEYTIADAGSIISRNGLQIKPVGTDQSGVHYNGKYLDTFEKNSPILASTRSVLETIESLRQKNPGYSEAQLWEFYFATSAAANSATARELVTQLQIPLIAGTIPGTTAANQIELPVRGIGLDDKPANFWTYQGRTIRDQSEVNRITQSVLGEQAFTRLGAGAQRVGVTSSNIQIARRGNEFLRFQFDDKNPANSQYVTMAAGEIHTLRETYGEGQNQVYVDRDVKVGANNLQVQGIILRRAADKTEMPIDEQTAIQVRNLKGQVTFGNDVLEYRNPNGLITRISDPTGNRIEEIIREIYFDENGRPLSNSEAKRRNLQASVRETLQSKSTKDGQTYTTNFNYRTENRNGVPVRISEGTITNAQGEFTGMVYTETEPNTGFRRTVEMDKNGNVVNSGAFYDSATVQRAKTANSQRKSREFFSGFQFIFTEFRGIGYIPSLFGFDDDRLIEWRNKVDRYFSPFLGTEYWQSKMCTELANLATENEGVAYAETPQGLAQVGAHIEATRTKPISPPNGTITYIYKITFQVRNGDYENDPRAPKNMSMNVYIIPKDRDISSGVRLFKNDTKISRGSTFGKFGKDAIVQESKAEYEKICIKFDEVPLKWKLKDNLLCNKIEESSGAPTTLEQRNAGQNPNNADLNDF